MKNEIHSQRVNAGVRHYFIDVKKAKDDSKYVTICESRSKDDGSFERNSIMIFQEHFKDFTEKVNNTLRFLEEKG